MENKDIYNVITEAPGTKASREQVERIYNRYCLAKQFSIEKDVCEIACGTGMGLPYLAKYANSVYGGDIDSKNIKIAKEVCSKTEFNEKISIEEIDAHNLPLDDNTYDLAFMFESIYYLEQASKFVSESHRILRENGVLMISTVNKDWKDFHPSPFTHKYYSVPELYDLLKADFSKVEMYGAFPVGGAGIRYKIFSLLKRMAIKLHMIPGSLGKRAFLKRIFFGKLINLPDVLYDDMAKYDEPIKIADEEINNSYKIIYAVAYK